MTPRAWQSIKESFEKELARKQAEIKALNAEAARLQDCIAHCENQIRKTAQAEGEKRAKEMMEKYNEPHFHLAYKPFAIRDFINYILNGEWEGK